MKWLALMSLALIAAVGMTGFERKAVTYLDPKVQPRPEVYEGPVPNFEDSTYRNHKCWNHKDGLVCSACYDHPKHYLGQCTVLCPYNKVLCRYAHTAKDLERFGVDPNQCVLK